jgi:hypothetical protein
MLARWQTVADVGTSRFYILLDTHSSSPPASSGLHTEIRLAEGPLATLAGNRQAGGTRPHAEGRLAQGPLTSLAGSRWADGKRHENAIPSARIPPSERVPRVHRLLLAMTSRGFMSIFAMSAVLCILCHMVPSTIDHFSYLVPPRRGPEYEYRYSFRAYLKDLQFWCLLTDLRPEQQGAAILIRLDGAARETARALTIEEIVNGDVVNRHQYDPVSFLIVSLCQRFGQFDEETRLVAMTEFMVSQGHAGEDINSVLSRFDAVRSHARRERDYQLSVEGDALMLLRVLRVDCRKFIELTSPKLAQRGS